LTDKKGKVLRLLSTFAWLQTIQLKHYQN